jgi:hypothetical protein
MNIIHDCYGQNYTFAPNLYLNDNGGDSTPITYDQIYSPTMDFTGGVGTGSQNNRNNFPDFGSLMQVITNGAWQLILNVGDPSQHSYTFTVSSTLAGNPYVNVVVDYPPDGATNVPPLPNFVWQGPANAGAPIVYVFQYPDFFQYAFPSVTDTNTTDPPALAAGDYSFNIYYEANVSASVMATTPRDGSGNPPPNWDSKALFDTSSQAGFTVVVPQTNPPVNLIGGHTNIIHYTFDNSGNLGLDSSGNGNDLNGTSGWGPPPSFSFSTNAKAGGGAVQFFGNNSMDAFFQTFTAWTNTLSGSFSVSVWINTTNTVGYDGDNLNGYNDQSVIDADIVGGGVIPVGLTGSRAAFLTIDADGNADTLHSQQSVTTGRYVHIVSTRDQTTGQKCIYINGRLDSSDYATLELLTGETFATVGGWGGTGYTGLVDDVQLYTGVLQAADVSNLYANPGATVPNYAGTNASSPLTLGKALNATNLIWTSSGDASWFPETTHSYDGVSAVQSGSLLDSQSSLLQTSVTGPGTLTFWWQYMANDDSFDLEFEIDGNDTDDLNINYDTSWTQDTWTIPAGVHTLTWDANTFNDTGSSPTDAGWVGDVVFTPASTAPSPVTLLPPALVGTNFQFSFVSQANHTNYVQYSTNLANTNWLPYSTIIGDGTTKSVTVPANTQAQEYFRVETQ